MSLTMWKPSEDWPYTKMASHRLRTFGLGLPRCAGQTLQMALSIILNDNVLHSPARDESVLEHAPAAVEIFYPLRYLERTFPGSRYILNTRSVEPWLESCGSVYHASGRWSHPIWRYPLTLFRDFRHDYLRALHSEVTGLGIADRVLVWDITQEPEWPLLSGFLGLPVPSVPFPRIDRFKVAL